MSLRPLLGHTLIRSRLARANRIGKLPASLLLTGPVGVGKQRLGLWLAQLLLCERVLPQELDEPCGECKHCRYALRGQHPDLHWFYPRERLSDADIEDVNADLAEATAERMKNDGLWTPSAGNEGLFMIAVQALIKRAGVRPAMAPRAVFVVGDAERMVPQASSPEAANAFLKLLEEPPPDTTIILTSSEPGSLLPTIKSRVVTLRVLPLQQAEMVQFMDEPAVAERLKDAPRNQLMASAAGSPGMMLGWEESKGAFDGARRVLEAALKPAGPAGTSDRLKVSAKQGVAGARGAYSDMLDALVLLLHDRARQLAIAGHERQARRTAQGIVTVLNTKEKTLTNVSPQLLTASLVNSLHTLLTQ
jgi:DNA polymerase-3 subunit delta'